MAVGQKYLSKKGGRFYCLFVDFSKAFDTISHVKLINCLIRKDVGSNYLKLLISMYSGLYSCFKISENENTKSFRCNIGTRQGCKLSPVLFSIFINDLIEHLRVSNINRIQV